VKKPRKHYTGEEKVAILRRHLLEKEPISKLCDELGLQPTVFYRWQKEFFENGAVAFQSKGRSDHQAEQERIQFLTASSERLLKGPLLGNCSTFSIFKPQSGQRTRYSSITTVV